MAGEFRLDDRQWAAIEPLLPKNQSGAHRKDDRRVISGIIHVLKVGCRRQDCPAIHGPPTTIYNRFHRVTATIEAGGDPGAGNRVRLIGYDTLLEEEHYQGFPQEFFCVAGDVVQALDGVE